MDNNQNLNNEQQTPVIATSTSQQGSAITSMVLGILSIVFGMLPGIVMSAIALKLSAPVIQAPTCNRAYLFAKVGKVTGIVGLAMSIANIVVLLAVFIIYFVVYILLIIFALAMA